MHSRIFQVSKNEITEDNQINSYRYDEGFIGNNGVDYVVDSESRKDDLEWLTNCHKGLEVNTKGKNTTLKIVSKTEYFEKKFEEFQEYLNKLKDYTMEDFVDSSKWLDMYRLKDAYNDEHGFYIDDNDEYHGITTFDEFIRNAEDGDVYYIGRTFDYHF